MVKPSPSNMPPNCVSPLPAAMGTNSLCLMLRDAVSFALSVLLPAVRFTVSANQARFASFLMR